LKILQKTPHKDIFPLLEIVDKKFFNDNTDKIKDRFSKGVLVELPPYLTDRGNKYFGGVINLLEGLDGDTRILRQTDFYKKNKDRINIPVISSSSIKLLSYKDLIDGFNDLKAHYPKIAVRIFIRSVELTDTNIKHLEDLMTLLRKDDIILLDVVEFDGVEQHILNNLEKIIDIIPKEKIPNSFILNAFDATGDWRVDVHHYAPLLAKLNNLSGFGDFATMPRFEEEGGSNTSTSVIRFFSPWDSELVHFKSNSFADAKVKLKNSGIWRTVRNDGHFTSCDSCREINNKDTEWKTFWKIFRINHHINSIMTKTIPSMTKYNNPQDFDMDGYNNIFKKTK
jgi:hypothetical protein